MIAPLLAATPSGPPASSTPMGGRSDLLLSSDFLSHVVASYSVAGPRDRPAPAVSDALPASESSPVASPSGTDDTHAVGADRTGDLLGDIKPAGTGIPASAAPALLAALVDQQQMRTASAVLADSTRPAVAPGAAHPSHPTPGTIGKPLPSRSAAPAASSKESPTATAAPAVAVSVTDGPGDVLSKTSPSVSAPPDTLDAPRCPLPVPDQEELPATPPQVPTGAPQERTPAGSATQGSVTQRSVTHGTRAPTRVATTGTSKLIPLGGSSSADVAVPVAPQPPRPPEITPPPSASSPPSPLADGGTRDEAAAVGRPSANTLPAQQVAHSDVDAATALTASSGSPRPLPPSTANDPSPDPVHPAAIGQLSSSLQPVVAGSATPLPAHPAQQPVAAPQPSPDDLTPRNAAVAPVAPALVHVAAATDGVSHVTVKLTPVELGEVRIHIERPSDGPVQVTVEATRPETLRLLRQDEPALHRALDQAGLPPEGRTVVLQQAADGPSLDAGGARRDATSSGQSSTDSGQGGQGSSRGWQQPGDAEETQDRSRPHRSSWTRAGINITA